jgi:hypothetical protein
VSQPKLLLQSLGQQRKRGRPPAPEHPNRIVKSLGTNKILVQDEPDAQSYAVAFHTAAMRDAFLRTLAKRALAKRA